MKKLNYIDVKNNIENFGYKLLSEKYINALTKLEMQCPEGHDFEIKYNNFQQGQRCSICFGTPKKILNEIKEYIESFNYKLLSTEYKDNRTKLELQCSEGHIFKMAYGSFKNQNYRCPECAGNRKFIIEDIKEYIESFDYKLLSTEYVNIFSKLKIQCLKGHIYAVTYNNFKNHNRRCPECSNSKMFSKPEKEIAEYVKENYTYIVSQIAVFVIRPLHCFLMKIRLLMSSFLMYILPEMSYWKSFQMLRPFHKS